MSDTITLDTHSHVLEIGLNRPAKRNAFELRMLRELAEALRTYEQDATPSCAILFAHGDHFTAGFDLAEVGPAVASGAALFPPDSPDLVPTRRTKPLVCAVSGWCLTIGIELLLARDPDDGAMMLASIG